jgi:hypothetical protein
MALVLVMAPASAFPAATLTPLIVGWEQFFKVDWEPGMRGNQPVVRGHVLNDWGMPATSIRLLVEGLDSSGQVVTQKVGWLGSSLPPGVRAPFEIPVAQRLPVYRVSVFAFDWVQAGNGADRR